MKGCPLSCRWCHNPESIKSSKEVSFNLAICTRCGECVDACPEGSIILETSGVRVDKNTCVGCGRCVIACPSSALELKGDWRDDDTVLRELLEDKDFYNCSGGGVSISGGEPLQQADFVFSLLEKSKKAGLHTVLDTSGYCDWKLWEPNLKLTDLILFDVKAYSELVHQRLTGVSNKPILENLRNLLVSRTPLIIRIPVIPGMNDAEDEILSIGRFISDAGGVKIPVNLLPFHRYGEYKYEQLSIPYAMKGVKPPSISQMEKLGGLLASCGLDVKIYSN
jgi:pyruvate formate lyase activating enzyme